MLDDESPDRDERAGLRCDIGCESWPDMALFAKCPICGERTTRYTNLVPLPLDEAMSLYKHAEFEKHYEKHCAQRGITVEGPLPDGFVAEQD